MRTQHTAVIVSMVAFAAWSLSAPAIAQVVLQTEDLRLEIGADGIVKSLTANAVPTRAGYSSTTECLWTAAPMPVAAVYRGGQMAAGVQEDWAEDEAPVYRGGECFPATSVSLTGNVLNIEFAKANVTAHYLVITRPRYLAFKLSGVKGEPIDRIDLLQFRVKRLPHLAPWINAAYGDRFGLCLCGGSIKTNAGMNQYSDYVEMRAIATRDVGFASPTAVLFARPDFKDTFLYVMGLVEREFDLPSGAHNRQLPAQKSSYLWCTPTPDDIDQYIAIAKRAGFRTILFSYTAFTEGAGHFRFNARFPNGMADVKKVADRIRAAGLSAGLHIHYSKADRADSYVTPVPDDRFHKVRTLTLAADVDEKAEAIAVRENPDGCPRAEGRRLLKINKELVAYTGYTTQTPFMFNGCQRGHLKTAAAAHRAGEAVEVLDVDDWIKFIRFDQDTDIQDEAARRIAEIFNATGPYEMLYFDGAEDVHDPFWYHVANAQYRVYRLLKPPPPVCETAMSGHFSWHIMTRGNAYDVDGKHIKSFIREIACRTAPARAEDFTRINFGWIFKFYPDAGPDVWEYIQSRAAAWDCPFSLRLTLPEVAAHPRAGDCFDAIKIWEDARCGGKLTDAQRAMLRTLDPKEYKFIKTWHAVFVPEFVNAWKNKPFSDQEHHLFVNEKGEHELAAVREVADVAGGRVKAFLFQRPAQPADTYAILWAVKEDVNLTLSAPPDRLALMRPFGKPVSLETGKTAAVIPVGNRCYLRLSGIGPDQAANILHTAK